MSGLDTETFTLGGVFVVGLATSLHCAGMCGLLTCGLGIAGNGPHLATVGIYHGFRLVGYALAGLTAGAIGSWFGLESTLGGLTWLPILLVALLIAVALGLEKKIGALPFFTRLSTAIRVRAFKFSPMLRAAVVGIATPLLPCGPLYAVLALALSTGSAVRGSEVMLAFSLGALPAIWATQAGSVLLSRRLSTRGYAIARRSLAVVAALSLVWHFTLLNPFDAERGETCRCGTVSE